MTAIAISGRIGSGKSTVAQELASLLGCRSASFGDFVRAEARERGIETNRETLQRLGQELIEDRGFDGFLGDVLERAAIDTAAPFIIEGVRHVGVLDAITRAVPGEVVLVYLDAPDEQRAERLRAREGREVSLEEWERHDTEHDVRGALSERADLAVAAADAPAAAREIADWMRGRGNAVRN